MEIKEVPEEKKEKSPSGSPHFYRKGTTPNHTPTQSPGPTPPPSPPQTKKKSFFSRKQDNKTPTPETVVTGITKAASKISVKQETVQEVAPPPKPAKLAAPVANAYSSPGNGELHSEYHGYKITADVMSPPDPPEEEMEIVETPTPAPVRQYRAPTPKPMVVRESRPESRLKKQESLRPKSLAETKKASLEITTDIVEQESVSALQRFDCLRNTLLLSAAERQGCLLERLLLIALTCCSIHVFCKEEMRMIFFSSILQGPNSILIVLVMLINIGLAIIFVHFLT